MDWENEQKEYREQVEKRVIESYKQDEMMMVLVFAQWCVNNDFDPVALYNEAYPGQVKNKALLDAVEMTVPREESETIDDQILLNVLQLFGNDDLAFNVKTMIEKRENKE